MRYHNPAAAFRGVHGTPRRRREGEGLVSYEERIHYPPVPDPVEWYQTHPGSKKRKGTKGGRLS
jgi:hypothetical protein